MILFFEMQKSLHKRCKSVLRNSSSKREKRNLKSNVIYKKQNKKSNNSNTDTREQGKAKNWTNDRGSKKANWIHDNSNVCAYCVIY